MRLTRRNAIAVIGGLGFGSAALGQQVASSSDPTHLEKTMVAMADLVLPESVTVDTAFVSTYVLGRSHPIADYNEQLRTAVVALDRRSRSLLGDEFASLRPDHRWAVIRSLGVDRARSNPTGAVPQRIRYYLVHELLYAFYSSPVGGSLVGMENPPGYPGGREAYRRGPQA